MPPPTLCTILSCNYLASARVLARSFLERHPDGRVVALLVDREGGELDRRGEPFEWMEIEQLRTLPAPLPFLFQYRQIEANTAAKPYFLAELLEETERLVYLDPDVLVTASLDPVFRRLEESQVLLTPHLTRPIEDDAFPDEEAILANGCYNLGFLALRRSAETLRMLEWWQRRVRDRCLFGVPGMFLDQRWMDLAPGLFEDVEVVRDPGWNVGYWNLDARSIAITDEGFTAAGSTLLFFHFSGVEVAGGRPSPAAPVSVHQDRLRWSQAGDAAVLYRDYCRRRRAEDEEECRRREYAFGRFSNGVPIPNGARSLYHSLADREERFPNPFDAGASPSFYEWMRQSPKGGPEGPASLSRLHLHLHRTTPQLRALFPEITGADRPRYRRWLRLFGASELGLPEPILPVNAGSPTATGEGSGLGAGWSAPGAAVRRLYHSDSGRRIRTSLKRRLGRRRARSLRDWLARRSPVAALEAGRTRLRPPLAISALGVNVLGYLDAESGMGEAARGLCRALEAAGVPMRRRSLEDNVLARRCDRELGALDEDLEFDVNLLCINADQVLALGERLEPQLRGRYNVGYLLWEQEQLPTEHLSAFDLLHEVWTPSTFCLETLSARSPVPVRRAPIAIDLAPPDPSLVEELRGEAGGAFRVLSVFNYLSGFERKNPLASIAAFERAFARGEDCRLLIKSAHSDHDPAAHRQLERAASDPRVELVDGYFDRDRMRALVASADCLLALHRAEGLGLVVAEAMALGTPVVASGYSGVRDLLEPGNSYPVRFRRRTLDQPAGPYPAGGVWSEPDLEHAARRLRQAYEDRDEAQRRARRALETVRERLSAEEAGRIVRGHLEAIAARVNGRFELAPD